MNSKIDLPWFVYKFEKKFPEEPFKYGYNEPDFIIELFRLNIIIKHE